MPLQSEHEPGPFRVLVIDDLEAIRILLKEVLSREGCEVTVAADGEEGLAAAARHNPQLVMLDVCTPGLPCRVTLRRLVAMDPAPPVLLLTALEDPAREGVDMDLVAGVLRKPFDIDRVRWWVNEVRRGGENLGSGQGSPGEY